MRTIVITGMDGAGKTTLQESLAVSFSLPVFKLHLPMSEFVHSALCISGEGDPYADTWTDRLIFALDNRLAAYRIRKIKQAQKYKYLLMQRGWMDSLILGATQGYAYEQIIKLMRLHDLPKPTCSIYLNCDPEVAYKRIESGPADKDKFETPEFMDRQALETERFYAMLDCDPMLKGYFQEYRTYIDTTKLAPQEVLAKALTFLSDKQVIDKPRVLNGKPII